MKLITWNVNGIRACVKNGFIDWFSKQRADIVCLQETKAHPEQLSEETLHPLKYHSYWHSAEKKGYSSVAIYSKKEPLNISYGIGVKDIDKEGRVLTAEYPDFYLITAYFPNSQREHTRLDYKIAFCKKIHLYMNRLKKTGKDVILCGDFNVAHHEIDLKNPKANKNNAGFLPQERAWMDNFLNADYVDIFRHFVKEPEHYTWWSYRPGVRQRNIGWRLDYFCSTVALIDRVKKITHQSEVMGSDHCPVMLQLKR